MPEHTHVPIESVRECLERSDYLMESRIVRALTAADFFVEPNVSHKDPRTGKAREIDLTAESSSASFFHVGVCVKTTFVIEVVREDFLLERVNAIRTQDEALEERMYELKKATISPGERDR